MKNIIYYSSLLSLLSISATQAAVVTNLVIDPFDEGSNVIAFANHSSTDSGLLEDSAASNALGGARFIEAEFPAGTPVSGDAIGVFSHTSGTNLTAIEVDMLGSNPNLDAIALLAWEASSPFEIATTPTFELALDASISGSNMLNLVELTLFDIHNNEIFALEALSGGLGQTITFDDFSVGAFDYTNLDTIILEFAFANQGSDTGQADIILDNLSIVPEPSEYALIFGGLGLALGYTRWRKRKS